MVTRVPGPGASSLVAPTARGAPREESVDVDRVAERPQEAAEAPSSAAIVVVWRVERKTAF
jgi:hypothetical protein